MAPFAARAFAHPFVLVFLGGLAVATVSLGLKRGEPPVTFTPSPDSDTIDFARDIRPILSENCYLCHGPDPSSREADLRLDLPEGLLATLEGGGTPVAPGDRDGSELWRRINTPDPDDHMPPAHSGKSLSPEQIDLLGRWIDAGAPWRNHWSFEPILRHPLPIVSDPDWCANGIDRFVLARLDSEGMSTSPRADRATLLRRVSLDLIGLPPTLDEVSDFLTDTSPDAYEKVIDRLLASPRFGERWARVWLDLARYADTKGYEADRGRTIWPYRDWVIRAFNEDMPFEQFTVKQLAGDLVPGATEDDILATAFHRNTMNNDEGGTDDEEFRVAAIKDRVATTFSVWSGLTMNCAECHTHKYDPVTHTEYYETYAFFNQTADADRNDEAPTRAIDSEQQHARIAEIEIEIKVLKSQIDPSIEGHLAEAIDTLGTERAQLDAQILRVPVMVELPADKQRTTRRLEVGSFLSPAEEVTPGVPQALHEFPDDLPRDRLGLARWLALPENPLTPRVMANRFWERFFGRGIVETMENFGAQGTPPSHPELLDHLALSFLGSGGSMKALCREIVLSSTYQQSSDATPELIERDLYNTYLGRGPRFRIEAEMIRDQALAVSGLLSPKMFGPPVYPPQPEGIWQVVYSGESWMTSTGEDRYRRGLYTYWRRTSPYPSMTTFDAPSRELCTPRRLRTNTPLQALVTLNDPVYVEAAQALARRMIDEGGPIASDRAAIGLRLCLVREPEPAEIDAVLSLVADEYAHYRDRADDAIAMSTDPLGPLPDGLNPAEAAAWTIAANVMLNLDEFLTRK